jgi:diguanylate cyclase (GGDEF)-like protein
MGDPGVVKVPWWRSVSVKLISGVLLLTLATGAAVWAVVGSQQERLFTGQRVREAGITSATISRDFAEPMLGGAGQAVWAILTAEAAEIARRGDALRVMVFLADGRIMASSDKAAIGTSIGIHDNSECPSCASTRAEDFPSTAIVSGSGGPLVLRVVNPIPITDVCRFCHKNDAGARSFVAVDFDMSALEQARRGRQLSILIMGLVSSVVLVAMVTWLFRALVTRPMAVLTGAMEHLASGDLSARVQLRGNDELTRLGRDFNDMAARLEDQVARIETARTESTLLYTLVVQASKNLETSEVAHNVCGVILEKLHPQITVFFLETGDGGWICAAGGPRGADVRARGEGSLEEALAFAPAPVAQLLEGISATLVAYVRAKRSLQTTRDTGGITFALPIVSEGRILGLLICVDVPLATHLDEDLLGNLGAHLALAAANSRNYTGAITDALTRLKNKRYGVVRLEEAVHAARRYGSSLAVVMCDIDHFKRVNDTYGHPAGDAVLREVARRIAGIVRKADIAVRYGGEEFMLILPQAGADALAVIGEKIRHAIEEAPVGLGAAGGTVPLTLSVGIAGFRADRDSGETLIARADAALYRAKEAGRNRVATDA